MLEDSLKKAALDSLKSALRQLEDLTAACGQLEELINETDGWNDRKPELLLELLSELKT